MKKQVAILAVLMVAAPAWAAGWSFYGSHRVVTWYVDRDYGDTPVNAQDDDQATRWYFQGNSRLGAAVLIGRIPSGPRIGPRSYFQPLA